jgi:Putative transposase
MLQWEHSGFSVDDSVRIPAGSSRTCEALSQYIARAPVSLSKLVVEEHAATVLYHTAYNPYFRTNCKLFRATDFIAELLQHLPDPRLRLIRHYGLYSSRSRGTWLRKPHLVRLAPEGWRQDHNVQAALLIGPMAEGYEETSVTARQSPASWARLIAKVYEADPLICRHFGSPMRILAVITDPQQVRKILLHLIKTGKAPPELDVSSLN